MFQADQAARVLPLCPWSFREFRAIVATRRYAKRQLTWLRSVESGLRLDGGRADVIGPILEMLARQGLAAES